ncbi:MAG: hypothetical protein WCR46_24540 [Deltaproteobacteria bacterium]
MKLNQERFFIKSQLTVLNTIAKRVGELRYDIEVGNDAKGARIEITYIQTYCVNGFAKMDKVHRQNEDLIELWNTIYGFVMKDYVPHIGDNS